MHGNRKTCQLVQVQAKYEEILHEGLENLAEFCRRARRMTADG